MSKIDWKRIKKLHTIAFINVLLVSCIVFFSCTFSLLILTSKNEWSGWSVENPCTDLRIIETVKEAHCDTNARGGKTKCYYNYELKGGGKWFDDDFFQPNDKICIN